MIATCLRRLPVALSVCWIASFAPALHAQNKVWVDPATGSDVPGAGTSVLPFATLTYCVTQVPAGHVEIVLRPGFYTFFSGEQFPITMPPDFEMYAEVPNTVTIATTVVSSVIPKCIDLPAGSQFAHFHDLTIWGNAGAVVTNVQVGDFLTLRMERCELLGGWGLYSTAARGQISIDVRDCYLNAANTGAKLHAENGATFDATFTNCEFENGMGAVQCGSTTQANSTLTFAGCSFHGSSFSAFSTAFTPPASMQVTLDHVVFASIGKNNAKPALKDGASSPTYFIKNSIFFETNAELPDFGPSYTVDHTIFCNAAVPGTGNFVADPKFVDATNGDYHLKPGSPAIDTGDISPHAFDIDGEPIPGHPSLSGPALTDIGLDEFYVQSFYFRPSPVLLQQTTKLRATGPANGLVFLMASPSLGNASFGPHYHLGTVPKIAAIGFVDPNGVFEVTLPPLFDIGLLGLTAYVQLAYIAPGGQGRLSYDHQVVTFKDA